MPYFDQEQLDAITDPPLVDNISVDDNWPDLWSPKIGDYEQKRVSKKKKVVTVKVDAVSDDEQHELWELNKKYLANYTVLRIMQLHVSQIAGLPPQWVTWMSDSPRERHMMTNAAEAMKGGRKVLIGGLGIGLIPQFCIMRGVEEVVVVEKDPILYRIVARPLMKIFPQIRVVISDIYDFIAETDEKFDHGYIDIWADLTTDNLGDMNWFRVEGRKVIRNGGRMLSWGHQWTIDRQYEDTQDIWVHAIKHDNVDYVISRTEYVGGFWQVARDCIELGIDQDLDPKSDAFEALCRQKALAYYEVDSDRLGYYAMKEKKDD